MNYLEACETEVTAAEAKREIAKHNAIWADFTADCGEKESYLGREILSWLGY